MRIEGRWHLFDDGATRPVVDAFVQKPDGAWKSVTFLLDSGADRTVFEASLLPLLNSLVLPDSDPPNLSGVGGKVGCLLLQTRLGFTRDDGKMITVGGSFGIFTELSSSDVSILGRDVTDNFDVIYSFSKREVLLLATPHSYLVQLPF